MWSIILPVLIILAYLAIGIVGYSTSSLCTNDIFEKWIPATIAPTIAGIFLVILVPWANHKYWQTRTEKERKWSDVKQRKQILSDFAGYIEGAFFYMKKLAELREKEKDNTISADIKTEIMKEEFFVSRLNLKNEIGIGKMARLIEVYFSTEVLEQLRSWIDYYNKVRTKYESEDFSESHPLTIKSKGLLGAMGEGLDPS